MGMNRREFSDYYAFHTVRFKIGKRSIDSRDLRNKSAYFECLYVYLGKAEGAKRGKKSKCNRGYRWKENGIYS